MSESLPLLSSVPLSAQRIASLLPPELLLQRPSNCAPLAIECVASTGSTNADLLARLPQLDGPLLYAAEGQTAGRGRAGRTWQSEPGAALTFSLAWPFQRPLQGLSGLPLAIGVGVAQALAAFDVAVRLKWPNDILLNDAKLAGILIETSSAGRNARNACNAAAKIGGSTWVVIGIGINLAISAQSRTAIGQAVAQLPSLAPKRNAVMAALLTQLIAVLNQFERAGLAPFIAQWEALHAHAGQQVRILDNGRVLHEGQAIGIDAAGCLQLQTEAGTVSIAAGDVSVRAANAHAS